MNKISIYLPLLVLASCAAEDAPQIESPVDSDAASIVVCGGSVAPGATRADEFPEPFNYGICNADQILILSYKGEITAGTDISISNMKYFKTWEVSLPYELNSRDKWTTHTADLSLTASRNNWFAFPTIAFSSADKDKFSVAGDTYNDIKLSLPTSLTEIPELYFGRLVPKDYKSTDLSSHSHESEGMTYKYLSGIYSGTDNQQLSGKLYRIVSQLNVIISEVSEGIEKIEMYLSNVPTEIGLYAKHRTAVSASGTDRGYFYPIVEASGDGQHKMTETLVCTVTEKEFEDGMAKLSTFILPSDKGRTIIVKAYLKSKDINGNDVLTRTLQASKDYSLDEATSKVYFSSTELPVYKAALSEFMSYPNVRVNVSGKLSDIFAEESESNIVIEICPNYDGEHNITI